MPAPRAHDSSIVEAKLFPGVGSSPPLARPQLDHPPRAFLEGEVAAALICAPAGYGKTTVMAGWHALLCERGIACAWLSLDPDDNDSARFLRHLVAAFQGTHHDIGRDVLAQLRGLQSGGVKPLLESLAADLGSLRKRAVLFLDDLHFATHRDVQEIIHWLINYAPRSLQFVLGSRGEPRLRLSGLRVRRRLLDLRAADLALSADEASRFLSQRMRRPIEPAALEIAMRKTEGWPAALELVAAALQSVPDARDQIARFAQTDRSVFDYLGEMVLSGLSPTLQAFAGDMALFDRFNAALASQVTGTGDAHGPLSELQALNLFLVPMDPRGEWFRFHHLVGEYFRERVARESPARLRTVLEAGARWLFDQGEIEEAINTALRARAFDLAVDFLSGTVEELVYRRGYHQTLTHWMHQLPDECVDRFPTIRINYAFSLAFLPRQREVEAQLHRLETMATRMARAPAADRAAVDSIRCAIELQVAISHALRDEGHAAREHALAWLQRWPEAPPIQKGHIANVLAFGHKTAGDIAAGLEVAAQGRRWHEQAEGWYGLAWNVFVEAMLHLKRGAYREARQVCEGGLSLIDRHLNGHRAHTSLLHTILAAVAYEFDEPDQAEAHMEQAMRSVQDHGPADAVIVAYLTQARLRFLRGDATSAYAILAEGQALAGRRSLERVAITLAAEQCTWLGRQGRHDEAHEAAQQSGLLHAGAEPGPRSGLLQDKSSRVALRLKLQHEPRHVVDALTPAIAHCERLGLDHRRAELHALRAMAYQRDGRTSDALRDLDASLQVAAMRQYLRTYLDEGAEIGELLRRMSLQPEQHPSTMPLVRRLLRTFERTLKSADPPAKRTPEGPYGELTRREIKLLASLESGMSNREIAESAFITEGTLKWHLTNIYAKLGAKNRSGALVQARGLGLI